MGKMKNYWERIADHGLTYEKITEDLVQGVTWQQPVKCYIKYCGYEFPISTKSFLYYTEERFDYLMSEYDLVLNDRVLFEDLGIYKYAGITLLGTHAFTLVESDPGDIVYVEGGKFEGCCCIKTPEYEWIKQEMSTPQSNAPKKAREGSVYYDTNEGRNYIFQNGGWVPKTYPIWKDDFDAEKAYKRAMGVI